MITDEKLRALKDEHPDAAVVCYVNSHASTKALSDVCVTSSNAVKIVSKLPQKDIVFIPDRHLGSFVAEQLPHKNVILYDGFCPVHNRITPQNVRDIKRKHPEATVIMHPECSAETRSEADYILSTGQMIEMVQTADDDAYIVVTEEGIIHALQKHNTTATFFPLISTPLLCENMKKITIEHVLASIETEERVVIVPAEIAKTAAKSLEKMLELAI
jgi:quinolinate synthase